ncbi:hypothetical protein QOZ80_6AG0535830 [Eleusine coracana subsp. coracana]|nr:hypothetical protein QOZ80_6AG0535830 [Eleusine coracana subsp. coracana]
MAPPALPAPVLGGANNKPPGRRLVAAHRLPLRATPDPDSPFGFDFSLDPDALALQLSRGLPAAVTFVGTLPASAASAVVPSDELDAYLMEKFSCLPVHLDSACHTMFYDTFCKRYLWPQLHYLFPGGGGSGDVVRFDAAAYKSFVSANGCFAERVMELLSPDDGDLVIIHDYHLWLLPTFLRRSCPRAGVGFFLHSPFPSADVFRGIPVREDLLRALLNADLLGFHTFDYAGHFLASCSRVLGVSGGRGGGGGHVGVDYHGRTVQVKVLAVGLDMGRLRGAMGSPEVAARAREIVEEYQGRKLIIGVDDVDRLKGVTKKLDALERLLDRYVEIRGNTVLVQINNPARTRGPDVDAVRRELNATFHRIYARYSLPGYAPVVMIDGPVSMSEKAAYYAAADCCVVSAVRDGLNRIPYYYTVCREEGPVPGAAAAAMENGSSSSAAQQQQRSSVVVVSEFVGCSPSLGGAIRVNPFCERSVAEGMYEALSMRTEEKQARHRRNYAFLASHDVLAWARAFDAALQVASRDLPTRVFVGLGFGLGYRAIAFHAGFKSLVPEHVVPAYRAAAHRLIVLQCDGTMVPNAEVTELLNELCADPMNVVFLVSGRGKDQLAEWFAPCDKLGISAEHGYFTRWSRDDPWEVSKMASDFEWKETAEPLMSHYTESTDGSYIENTESTMVWHYQNADPTLGPCQARELFDHLENLLAREPVSVTRGSRSKIVEVKPQGVNKGVAVEALISAMARRGEAPDFVLCFGDDENMFEALAGVMDEKKMPPLLPAGARVFTCTIGKAPSKAAFYLDEPPDVIAVLRGMLATTGSSSSSSSSSRLQPAVPPVRAPRRLGLFEIVSLVNNGSG